MFNFDNLYLIADNLSTEENINYNVSAFLNEEDESYLFIWDSEEEIIKWKIINSDKREHTKMSFVVFFSMFIQQLSGIKWILINPTSDVSDYETAQENGTEKLMLFSAWGVWSVIEYFANSLLDELNLMLLKQATLGNPDILPNEFLSNFQDLVLSKRDLLEKTSKSPKKFKNNVNTIVKRILDNSEFIEMGINFIDDLPIEFYTDIQYLISIEFLIQRQYGNIGNLLLLSSKSSNAVIDPNFLDKKQSEIISYIEKMAIFGNFLTENIISPEFIKRDDSILIFPLGMMYVNHVFIYNIAIEYNAKKWEDDHNQYFQDVKELNLDKAINRYCSIETIVHQNEVSIGIFIYYLIKQGKFEKNNRNYIECYEIFMPKLNELIEIKKHKNFINKLKRPIESKKKYSIDDIDLMDGYEFEKFVAELFSKMGFGSEITKASGDQGIDVIASKNGKKLGIQAKCYSSTVGNSAIQEAVAGKSHYRLDKVIVVTNNFFTNSAQQLAQSNSVILWDRHILKAKIDEIFNS